MKIKNLEKIYYLKSEEIKAISNFSYNFEKGKFYAIMGHSGSGKSSLIRILGLIDNFTSGSYYLNGEDISKLNDEELSKLRMEEIGFIFQEFYLDENLKAYENIILPMIINKKIKKEDRKEKAIRLLKELGLENRINHYPKELSGGEKQRICLARALANNPNYILADEPTGNLDELNEDNVFNSLKKLSLEGKCVVVVSHSKKVEEYADVIINIKNGKMDLKNG